MAEISFRSCSTGSYQRYANRVLHTLDVVALDPCQTKEWRQAAEPAYGAHDSSETRNLSWCQLNRHLHLKHDTFHACSQLCRHRDHEAHGHPWLLWKTRVIMMPTFVMITGIHGSSETKSYLSWCQRCRHQHPFYIHHDDGNGAPEVHLKMAIFDSHAYTYSTRGNTEILGAVSIRKTVLPGMAIPMLKIRRPNGRLIFNMEIAIRR